MRKISAQAPSRSIINAITICTVLLIGSNHSAAVEVQHHIPRLHAAPISWRRSILQQYYAPQQQQNTGSYEPFTPAPRKKTLYGSWGGTWGYGATGGVIVSDSQGVIAPTGISSMRLASGMEGSQSYTGIPAANAATISSLSQAAGTNNIAAGSVGSNSIGSSTAVIADTAPVQSQMVQSNQVAQANLGGNAMASSSAASGGIGGGSSMAGSAAGSAPIIANTAPVQGQMIQASTNTAPNGGSSSTSGAGVSTQVIANTAPVQGQITQGSSTVSALNTGSSGNLAGRTAVIANTAPVQGQIPQTGAAVAAGSSTGVAAGSAAGGQSVVVAPANSNLPAGFTIPSNTLNINAGVVTTPATTFADGYCVPRQSYIVVNTTAISCNPGSNLTRWDGQPICARIDCERQIDNGNILTAAAFCRTVVEPPQYYCPTGCDLITQNLRNTTANTTQTVARCACRAGNQPCPGSYVGCVCQPAFITNLNASTSYLVCGLPQTTCDTYCRATANTLGPLCPIQPDATLPGQLSTGENALNGPAYPRWSWDLASQGQATAAVAPGTPIGRRLFGNVWSGRRHSSSSSSSSSIRSWQAPGWLNHRRPLQRLWSVHAALYRESRKLPQLLRLGGHEHGISRQQE